MDDLQATPKPWRQFFGTPDEYAVPRSVAALADRGEANLVFFLPNYLRVIIAMLLLQLYLHPRALAAACVLLMTATVHASAAHNSMVKHVMPVLYVASMVIAQRGRCMVVVARWLLGSAAVTGLHATTRTSVWEKRGRVRMGEGHWTAVAWEVLALVRQGVVAMWVELVVRLQRRLQRWRLLY